MKIQLKKAQTHEKLFLGKHPMLRFYEKHKLASKLFLFNKETSELNFNLWIYVVQEKYTK